MARDSTWTGDRLKPGIKDSVRLSCLFVMGRPDLLVEKIAHIGQDDVAEFYPQQLCLQRSAKFYLE